MTKPLPTSDFFAHHSPFGAFSSFSLGRYGQGGGFGIEREGPASQDVFIGVSRPGEGTTLLPFFRARQENAEVAYTGVDAVATSASHGRQLQPEEIQRTLGWATDTWQTAEFTFRILTPFGTVPDLIEVGDGELRRHICPVLLAELTVDNRDAETECFGVFGIGADAPLRPLSDGPAGLIGMARANEYGFAVVPSAEVDAREILTWSFRDALATLTSEMPPPVHRLSNVGGVVVTVPPGEVRTLTMVLGFYRDGSVTTGIATQYLYSRVFADLETVLEFGVDNVEHYRKVVADREEELETAELSDERKFLIAHATHSYHGSTMLLHDTRGFLRTPFARGASVHKPIWVVNEGEYRMLNTFDLTVDHAFFELQYHPWTLRNTLDLFVQRYHYTDDVVDATKPERPQYAGGISFTHDMGVGNQFSPPGYSSYECENLTGCFSYMTQEQLCNWCLCAALYGIPNILWDGDLLWLAARRSTLRACLASLIRRDGPDDGRDGVMSLDSTRCGTGQEITTYDSLDPSLGQARNNAYLAVKTWASYLALSRCLDLLGDDAEAVEAEEQAARTAATLATHWNDAEEYFPAVLEPDSPAFTSRILPVVEGLVYPFLWQDEDAVSPYGRYGQMISQLRRHLKASVVPGICIDPTSGGLKLSSSANNTWMSKIFLVQFVAENILGFPLSGEFDAAHGSWQREGACRNFAFTDQVNAPDGRDLGSRFYPRGVTSVLWLLGEG